MNSSEQYRIILKRDADFWQDEIAITDGQNNAVSLFSAELTIHPTGEDLDNVVWNETNGKLEMPSTGVIRFSVELEEIAAYEWSAGVYCLAITYSDGKRDGSFLTGPVEVKAACLPTL